LQSASWFGVSRAAHSLAVAGEEIGGSLDEFDGLVGVGPEGKQIVSGLRCGAGGAHDGAIVVAQDLEPGADVVGVAHRRHDVERSADEGARDFGDQFLLRVKRGTETA
jgi:hypothetical protein